MTVGNLSGHISKLTEAGLVSVEKQFVARRPNTIVQITPKGRTAIDRHWQQLDDMRKSTRDWNPEDPG